MLGAAASGRKLRLREFTFQLVAVDREKRAALLTHTWILTVGYLHLLTCTCVLTLMLALANLHLDTDTWILTVGTYTCNTCTCLLSTHTWMHLTFCARTTFAHQSIFQLTPTHFPPSHVLSGHSLSSFCIHGSLPFSGD